MTSIIGVIEYYTMIKSDSFTGGIFTLVFLEIDCMYIWRFIILLDTNSMSAYYKRYLVDFYLSDIALRALFHYVWFDRIAFGMVETIIKCYFFYSSNLY